MGLDITAYSKLEIVKPRKRDEYDNADGLVWFYPNPDFLGRFDGLSENVFYRYADSYHFRAGSYSTYNDWRESLAKMVGYSPAPHVRHGHEEMLCAASCWAGASGPFSELVNFSDCEGAFGPISSAKLLDEFDEWLSRARKWEDDHGGTWFRSVYESFQKAFAMGAQAGAVSFD